MGKGHEMGFRCQVSGVGAEGKKLEDRQQAVEVEKIRQGRHCLDFK
jgi:hypothetical protein